MGKRGPRPERYYLLLRLLATSGDECVLWPGATQGRYGQVRHHGFTFSTHRLAWELVNGQVPEGMDIDHECEQTLCINPDHMRPRFPDHHAEVGALRHLA